MWVWAEHRAWASRGVTVLELIRMALAVASPVAFRSHAGRITYLPARIAQAHYPVVRVMTRT